MYYKTKGFILRVQKADKKKAYITAYSGRLGKITFIARGIFKNEAKLKSALLPFSYSELILMPTKGTPVITRASLIKNYYPDGFQKEITAFYLSDLVCQFTIDGTKDRRILSLLLEAFESLGRASCNKKTLMLLLTYFPLKLIKYSGYFPNLTHCNKCSSKAFPDAIIYLSYKFNGVLCKNCSRYDKESKLATKQEIYFLKAIGQKNFSALKKLPIAISSLQKLSGFANFYAFTVLTKIPASFAFIRPYLTPLHKS